MRPCLVLYMYTFASRQTSVHCDLRVCILFDHEKLVTWLYVTARGWNNSGVDLSLSGHPLVSYILVRRYNHPTQATGQLSQLLKYPSHILSLLPDQRFITIIYCLKKGNFICRKYFIPWQSVTISGKKGQFRKSRKKKGEIRKE